MAELICYACSSSFPSATHPAAYNAGGERVCPGCGSDFIELVEREQVGGRVGTAHPNVPRLTAARIGLLARLGIGQRPVRSTGLPVEGPLLGPPRRLAAPIAAPACLWHSCRPTLPRAEALLPASRPPSRHARG